MSPLISDTWRAGGANCHWHNMLSLGTCHWASEYILVPSRSMMAQRGYLQQHVPHPAFHFDSAGGIFQPDVFYPSKTSGDTIPRRASVSFCNPLKPFNYMRSWFHVGSALWLDITAACWSPLVYLLWVNAVSIVELDRFLFIGTCICRGASPRGARHMGFHKHWHATGHVRLPLFLPLRPPLSLHRLIQTQPLPSRTLMTLARTHAHTHAHAGRRVSGPPT